MAFTTSFGDITDAFGSLFGSTAADTKSGTFAGTKTERLQLDEVAVQKIIEDVLSGPEGLANIFAGEQEAGIFNTSVAAQAAGDLSAKLVGELAKLTGTRETVEESTTTAQQVAEEGGILSSIGDFFGF